MKMTFNFFIFFCSLNVYGGLLRVESDSFFSRRIGDDLKNESPFYHELEMNYREDKKWSGNFDFNYSYDFSKKIYSVDFNQLNLSVDSLYPGLRFSAGRVFDTKYLIKSSIVDSISLEYDLTDYHLIIGSMIGYLRNFEIDKYSKKAPVYTVYSSFKSPEIYPFSSTLKFEHTDYSEFNRFKNDSLFWSLRKDFVSYQIFGQVKKGLSQKEVESKTIGVEYYPRYDWYSGVSIVSTTKNAFDGFSKSLFSQFSVGKSEEFNLNLGHHFNHHFASGLTVGFTRYLVQSDQFTNGQKVDWSIDFHPTNFFIKANVFYINSFGGKAFGHKIESEYEFNDTIMAIFENEWVDYKKITSAKNQAIYYRFGAGLNMFRPFKLQALSEVRSNNFFKEEMSFLMRLNFVNWSEL